MLGEVVGGIQSFRIDLTIIYIGLGKNELKGSLSIGKKVVLRDPSDQYLGKKDQKQANPLWILNFLLSLCDIHRSSIFDNLEVFWRKDYDEFDKSCPVIESIWVF